MKSIIKNTAILFAITLVAAIALSFVYELTKEPIALAEQQKKAAAYQQVYSDAASFDDVADAAALLADYNATLTGASVDEVLLASDTAGEKLGYVFSVTAKGYGGDLRLALGIDKTGTVIGYAVLSHSESPGFGANCVNEDVKAQFIGITDASQVDGITGATISSNALRLETQAAIDLVKKMEGNGV